MLDTMMRSASRGQPYSHAFFDELAKDSRASAAVVLRELAKVVAPTSVLDLGCGIGTWLAEWRALGVTDVLGVDGGYVDTKKLHIPVANFLAHDLSRGLELGRRFDLVQCLEVAEHLHEVAADNLVHSLVRHGDTVLFSAAIPGQGGTHHVNEQWPSYWVELFRQHGYSALDILRPLFWNDSRISVWYRQNLLLFVNPSATGTLTGRSYPELGVLDVVHPELFEPAASAAQLPRRLSSLIPNPIKRAIRARLATGLEKSGSRTNRLPVNAGSARARDSAPTRSALRPGDMQ